MKIIFVFVICIIATAAKAQDTAKAPKELSDTSALYKVERESQYPGGAAAWMDFLRRVMHYPESAIRNRIEAVVVVQFVVDKDGKVSDVQTVSGPEAGGLTQEAERIIKRSGKWIPAFQHGKYVKSYKRQTFNFTLN
jgi:protein TonB